MKRLCRLLTLACLAGLLFASPLAAQQLRWSANPPKPAAAETANDEPPATPPPPPIGPPREDTGEAVPGKFGTAVLIVSVNADGAVENVALEKTSGHADLDEAAMNAARTWKFNAPVADGVPVAGRVRVPVKFEP